MSERYGFGTYEDNEHREDLARADGFTANGDIADDYLAAGRDPALPRQAGDKIAKLLDLHAALARATKASKAAAAARTAKAAKK